MGLDARANGPGDSGSALRDRWATGVACNLEGRAMAEINRRKAWNRDMLRGLKYMSSTARQAVLRQIEVNIEAILDWEGQGHGA